MEWRCYLESMIRSYGSRRIAAAVIVIVIVVEEDDVDQGYWDTQ